MSEIQIHDASRDGVSSNGASKAPRWHVTPDVDLYESDGEYLIELDVPGASLPSLSVQVLGRALHARAEQAAEEGHAGVALAVFERRLELPNDVDPDTASAQLKDGVLQIRVAKAASARRVRIPVSVS